MTRTFPPTLACLLAIATLCAAPAPHAQQPIPPQRDKPPTTSVSVADIGTGGLVLLQNKDGKTEQLDLGVLLANSEPTVCASYMGVGVDVPGDTVRSQLKLPDGTGLVINWIDDGGPAKGLLRQHDLLLKLDDQLLINGEQLVTLVRLHKPGETIRMNIIRESRSMTIPIPLSEKQVAPLKSFLRVNTIQQTDLDAKSPTAYHDFDPVKIDDVVINRLIQRATIQPATQPDRQALIRRVTLDIAGVPPTAAEVESFVNDKSPDAYQKLVHRLVGTARAKDGNESRTWKDMEVMSPAESTQWHISAAALHPDVVVANGDVVVHATHTGPVTIDDGEVLMWLQPAPDGSAELTALDRATGKNLFKGPIGTPEQWNAVPESVRHKFENWREAMQRASHAPATQPVK